MGVEKTGKILGATMVGLLAGHKLSVHWLEQLMHSCAKRTTRTNARTLTQLD